MLLRIRRLTDSFRFLGRSRRRVLPTVPRCQVDAGTGARVQRSAPGFFLRAAAGCMPPHDRHRGPTGSCLAEHHPPDHVHHDSTRPRTTAGMDRRVRVARHRARRPPNPSHGRREPGHSLPIPGRTEWSSRCTPEARTPAHRGARGPGGGAGDLGSRVRAARGRVQRRLQGGVRLRGLRDRSEGLLTSRSTVVVPASSSTPTAPPTSAHGEWASRGAARWSRASDRTSSSWWRTAV